MKSLMVLCACLMIFSGLAMPASAVISATSTATAWIDSFEVQNTLGTPPGNAPGFWKWEATSSAGSAGSATVLAAGSPFGNAGLYLADGSAVYAYQIRNMAPRYTPATVADGYSLCAAGSSLGFNAALGASVSVGENVEYRVGSAAPVTTTTPINSFGFVITGVTGTVENLQFYMTGSDGTPTFSPTTPIPYSAPAVIRVDFGQVSCGGTSTVTVQYNIAGGAGGSLSFGDNSAFTAGVDMDRVTIASTGTVHTPAINMWFDSLGFGATGTSDPHVYYAAPASGSTAGGNSVTVYTEGVGQFYGSTNPTILFGSTPATVTQTTFNPPENNQVVVTAPPHAAGLVSITVTDGNGHTNTQAGAYLYVAPTNAMLITAVTPSQGVKDTVVLVKVDKTDATGAVVMINGKVATIIDQGTNADCSVWCYKISAPANPVGTYDVTVTSSNYAVATATQAFTYNAPTFEGECPDYQPPNYESFDPTYYEVGDQPARCWYDYTAPGLETTRVTYDRYGPAYPPDYLPETGSLFIANTVGTGAANFALKNGWDSCGDKLSLAAIQVYVPTGAANGPYLIGISDNAVAPFTGTSHAYWISATVGGTTTINARNGASLVSSTFTGLTFQSNVWYTFSMYLHCKDTLNPSVNTFIANGGIYDVASNIIYVGDASGGGTLPVTATLAQLQIQLPTSGQLYTDSIYLSYNPQIDAIYPAPEGNTFVGMDRTADGSEIIYRQSGGGTGDGPNSIHTLLNNQGGFVSQASDTVDDCNIKHGVMAKNPAAVAWLSCPGSPAGTTHLTIREPVNFGPATNDDDYQDSYLSDDITTAGREIAKIARFPIDFSATNTAGTTGNVIVAFAYSELNTGRVGVYAEQQRDNAPDNSDTEVTPFIPNGLSVTQICAVSFDEDGAQSGATAQDYLVAVYPGYGLGVWKVVFQNTGAINALNDDFVTLQKIDSASNLLLANAIAVDCAAATVAVATSDGKLYKVVIIPYTDVSGNHNPGDILDTATLPDITVVRGVATTSNGGRYGVIAYTYGNGGSMNVLIRDTVTHKTVANAVLYGCSTSCPISEPELTMRLDRGNNYLVAMFHDKIVRVPFYSVLGDGQFKPDSDPLNDSGDPDGDLDGDRIENPDDPDPTKADADHDCEYNTDGSIKLNEDGTTTKPNCLDGEDSSVCPADQPQDGTGHFPDGHPCYNGQELAQKCAGKTNAECRALLNQYENAENGAPSSTPSATVYCNCEWTRLTNVKLTLVMGNILGILCVLALGILGARLGGAAIGGTGALVGFGFGFFMFCLPIWFIVVACLAGLLALAFVMKRGG